MIPTPSSNHANVEHYMEKKLFDIKLWVWLVIIAIIIGIIVYKKRSNAAAAKKPKETYVY